MTFTGFDTYNSIYTNLSAALQPWGSIIVSIALMAASLTTLCGRHSHRLKAQILILSVALASLILGCYYFAPNGAARIYSLYTGGTLLCMYGITWGLSAPPLPAPTRRWDIAALGVIALSTVLKFSYLTEWPPVLTDYAATTGVITVENNFYDGPISRKSIPRAYVEGGGASFLHAQLLTLLFNHLDFTIFSVRCAEVLASIATLIFLWLWLRIIAAPPWALLGLALFTFSAEHLSQSRMGTFYSLSQCVAIGTIWLWTAIRQREGRKTLYIVGLGLLNVAVASCYKPTVTVWILSGLLTLDYLTRRSFRGTRLGKVVLYTVALGLVLGYALSKPLIRNSLSLDRPYLPTDTSIWQKTTSDQISSVIQPPLVIAFNLTRNVRYIIEHATDHSAVREGLYDVLYAIVMVLAFAGLLSRRWGYLCLIILIGLLPSLTTFPLTRRSLMMRPFVPLCLLIFAREWLLLCQQTISNAKVKVATQAMCVCALISMPFQGIYRLTAFNGPIGVGPSFGPEYVHEMITHLRSLPPDHSIVIMNAGFGADKFRMAFARELYVTPLPTRTVHLTTIQEKDNETALPRTSHPTVYAVLNEDHRAWVVAWLQAHVPHIQIYPFTQGDRIIFWLGVAQSPQS